MYLVKLLKCGTLQSLLCKRAGFDPFSSSEATIQSRDQLHQHQQTLLFQCDTYQRNVFQFLIASIKNLETFATNPHQPSKMKRMVWYTHSLRNRLKENEEKVGVVFSLKALLFLVIQRAVNLMAKFSNQLQVEEISPFLNLEDFPTVRFRS